MIFNVTKTITGNTEVTKTYFIKLTKPVYVILNDVAAFHRLCSDHETHSMPAFDFYKSNLEFKCRLNIPGITRHRIKVKNPI